MKQLLVTTLILSIALLTIVETESHQLYNPYFKFFRYNVPYYNNLGNYANQLSYSANSFVEDPILSSYLSTPDVLPTLNVLAEVPQTIGTKFTVIPMLVVSKENMKVLEKVNIMSSSKKKPIVVVKTDSNTLIQCTPAVRIILEQPISLYSLKSSILFPTQIEIKHGIYKIPITVGAVIAPIPQNTFVSTDTPVDVKVVYAVPTQPVTIGFDSNYVNNRDVIDLPDTQAVVVEVENQSPLNVTVLEFPDKEATPVLQVDEEDDELVNRNPPLVLAPAGIVQSTQPLAHVESFINSKESPVLITLREESKKRV